MIFEEHQIRFIVTGKLKRATLPPGRKPCTPGRSYILQRRTPRQVADDGTVIPAQVKSTAHRLLITSVTPSSDGWQVEFTLDRQAPHTYLHRRSEKGYTDRQADAMPGEPEAVPSEETARWSSEATQNRDLRTRQQWAAELMELNRTIDRWKNRTDRRDILHELELIQRRAHSLTRKLAA